MGYMRHHAIIVTSWDQAKLAEAHAKARSLMDELVSGIVPARINGYASFLVGPDGSKEGWEVSSQGDAAREAFLTWLHRQTYDDGSSTFDWAHVQFGDEDGEQVILEASRAVVGPEGNLIAGRPGQIERARP